MLRRRRSPLHAPLLIVGLGNPGAAYAGTRHNVGAALVEELARRQRASLRRRGRVREAETQIAGRKAVLAVPTTFMNVSGPPVAKLAGKQSVAPEDLVVCHDDLDLVLGRVRVKVGGGTGGHRGLDSLGTALRSREFARLRIGIGRPPAGTDPADYVLARFAPEERDAVTAALARGIDGLEVYVRDGLEAAQNLLHPRG